MIYWQLFLAFLLPGVLGFGGGPASIPLVEHEVVDRYEWVTVDEFSEILAIGNSLPGPIATKLAGYIGYEVGGVLGAMVAIFANIAPTLILMIVLLSILLKYKDSPKVKRLTLYIRPAIAVLLGIMAYEFFATSYVGIGLWQTIFIAVCSWFLMEKLKVHPAFVIIAAFVYGGLILA
jgi:chromate transporter